MVYNQSQHIALLAPRSIIKSLAIEYSIAFDDLFSYTLVSPYVSSRLHRDCHYSFLLAPFGHAWSGTSQIILHPLRWGHRLFDRYIQHKSSAYWISLWANLFEVSTRLPFLHCLGSQKRVVKGMAFAENTRFIALHKQCGKTPVEKLRKCWMICYKCSISVASINT